MGANGSGTLWLDVPPTNQIPSAAYADGRYEQAGIGESPPSSDARHFFVFNILRRALAVQRSSMATSSTSLAHEIFFE
jgi:hypothetical protein